MIYDYQIGNKPKGNYLTKKYTFTSTGLQLVFISLAEAENIVPKPEWALISVTDPDMTTSIIYSNWTHHIRFAFEDVSNVDDGIMFSEQMAKRLIQFAESLPTTIKFVVVNCVAGVSRSGAILKFLSKYIFKECYNENFDKHYDAYNRTVYRTLEKVWKNKKIIISK